MQRSRSWWKRRSVETQQGGPRKDPLMPSTQHSSWARLLNGGKDDARTQPADRPLRLLFGERGGSRRSCPVNSRHIARGAVPARASRDSHASGLS